MTGLVLFDRSSGLVPLDVILILARTRLHLVTGLVLFDRSSGLVPLDVILIPARSRLGVLVTVLVLVVALLDQSLRWRYFLHTWFDGLSETLCDACVRFLVEGPGDFFGPVWSGFVQVGPRLGLNRYLVV